VNPDGAWAAVGAAVRERMTMLGLTVAELSRRTGLSETTVRSLSKGTAVANPSTLVAVSAALGWPRGYLRSVAGREPVPLAAAAPAPVRDVLARIEVKLDALLDRTG
jgi:transcriptional regulator with XRE-family HTH domain